jgi:hypothetical protein
MLEVLAALHDCILDFDLMHERTHLGCIDTRAEMFLAMVLLFYVYISLLRNSSTLACLFTRSLRDVESQACRIQINFIPTLLQDLRDILGVLKFPQANIASTLLDGFADKFCGTSFTLGTDNRGLFFLTSFVDYECGSLSFLLGDLFSFNGGGKFG